MAGTRVYGRSALEEERERRRQEEEAKMLAAQAEQAAADAQNAATPEPAPEPAQPATEPKQPEQAAQPEQKVQIDPASVNVPDPAHTGVRSGGLPKVGQEDIDNTKYAKDISASVGDTMFDVVGPNYVAARYTDDMDAEAQRKMYAGDVTMFAMGLDGEGERGAGNTITVDRGSFKDAKQMVLFSTTLTDDKNRRQLIFDYADDIGVDPYELEAEAEKWLKNTYNRPLYTTPQTDGGKIQAANNALGSIGLTDIGGNSLDVNSATPQQWVQAIRMNPDPDVHDEAYKAIQILQKTPGSQWYGMDMQKSDLSFLDSAELTKSDYDAYAKELASKFVFAEGENESNANEYEIEFRDINARYADNPRMRKVMLNLLNKTFEQRNVGVSAPDEESFSAYLAEKDKASAAADDQTEQEKKSWWPWGKKKEKDDTLDRILDQSAKDERQAMDGMLGIDKEGNVTYRGIGKDVSLGNVYAEPADAETPEVQGPQMPASKTASGSNNLASAANANMVSRYEIPEPIAVLASAGASSGVNFVPGAKNLSAVGQMIAEDQPSVLKDEAANLPYDPNMTPGQALAAYNQGKQLDSRNKALIEDIVGDEQSKNFMYACLRGYSVSDMYGGDINSYGSGTVSNMNVYGENLGFAMNAAGNSALNPELQADGIRLLNGLRLEMDKIISDPHSGFSVPEGKNQYDALIEMFPEKFLGPITQVKNLYSEQLKAEEDIKIEALEDDKKTAELYRKSISEGNGTREMAAWLAVHADEVDGDTDYFDAMNEVSVDPEYRKRVQNFLIGGSFWDDESYWGEDGGAAAVEMKTLNAYGEDAAGAFQSMLSTTMTTVLMDLEIDARQMNIPVGEYLEKYGFDKDGSIADLAYNKMVHAGYVANNDPELQKSLEKIRIGRINSSWLGVKHGATSTLEGVYEGVQHIAEDPGHEARRFDIHRDMYGKFGDNWTYKLREAMFEFANSGVLSEESKAEFLYELDHNADIADTAATYMNHTGFLSFIDGLTNDAQKDIETIEVIADRLDPRDRFYFNTASGLSSTGTTALLSIVPSTLMSPLIGVGGAKILTAGLQAFPSWSDTKEYYRTQKGAGKDTSCLMANAQFLLEAGINYYGASTLVDRMLGGTDFHGGMQRMMVTNAGTFAQNVAVATKYAVPSIVREAAEEGIEGGAESVAGLGLEFAYDYVNAEIKASANGQGPSLTRGFEVLCNLIEEKDAKKIGKDILGAVGSEAFMGGLIRLGTLAFGGFGAFRAAHKANKFSSLKMSAKMAYGDIPMNEKNIGEFMLAFKNDLENPEFVNYLNGISQTASDARLVGVALTSDFIGPIRKEAVGLAEQTKEYQDKVEADKAAVSEAQAAYDDLCEQVIYNKDLETDMNAAGDKLAKVSQTLDEHVNAYEKSSKLAANKATEMLNMARIEARKMLAEDIGRNLALLEETRLSLAQEIVRQADADEEAQRVAEEAIRAAKDAEAEEAADDIAIQEEETAKAEFESAVASEAETVASMTDEELDADIASIVESENAVPNAQAEADEMGYDEETMSALTEQAEADKQKNAAHKEAIVRNQRNSYDSLTARMQQAQELEDTDAYNALGEQRGAVQSRLEALGVTLDQETNAPEPTTDTAPARPNAKAPVAPKATTESVSPEPSTTTPAAKPSDAAAKRKADRIEGARDLVTGKTKEQRDAEKAVSDAQKAEQSIQERIATAYTDLEAELGKGDEADLTKVSELMDDIGLMEVELDDMQERASGEINEIVPKMTDAIEEGEQRKEKASKPVVDAIEARKALEEERRTLRDVFREITGKPIVVNATQLANMLYTTGAKNITELNRMLGTRLTQDTSKGIPLDGGWYQELKNRAPGYFREEWDTHPEDAVVALMQRKKGLSSDIASAKAKEKDLLAAYESEKAKGVEGVSKAAKDIPPGHALSQFENKTYPASKSSVPEVSDALAGTTHEIHKRNDQMEKAKKEVAQKGLKGTIRRLMFLDRMTSQDIVTASHCLDILKQNGDIVTSAVLAAKIGREATRTGDTLSAFGIFSTAERAVGNMIAMADAYNRKKGRFKSVNVSEDAGEQFSIGDTKAQPFMEAAVSRATSDPIGQKLASDVNKRSGLTVYWANMPDGMRGFFDRVRGVIVLNQKVGAAQGAYITAIHEFTHHMEEDSGYNAFADSVLKAAYGNNYEKSDAKRRDEADLKDEYEERGQELTPELLKKELVAAATEKILLGDEAFMRTLFEDGNGSTAVRILGGIDNFLRKRGSKKGGKEALERYNLLKAARSEMSKAVKNVSGWKADQNSTPQASVQVERQDASGNRQQAISDPDTYDRITASEPGSYVEMREQPATEQMRIEEKKQIGETTRKVLANIDAMNADEDVNTDNPWKVQMNPFQREQVARYGLENVKLPGLNYNRATKKQRQLCAILSTPKNDRGPGVMTLIEQLDALEKGDLAVVTNADYAYALAQGAIVEASETDSGGIPLDREGLQAYARMLDAQANIQPVSDKERAESWRFISMLSSPVTTIKNIGGNIISQQADRASTFSVQWLDKMIAKKTGTRMLASATKAEKKAGTEAMLNRGRDVFDDYFVSKANTSRSRNYEIGGDGRVYENEVGEFVRNAVGFAMDAPDQMMMEKTIVEEMGVLKRLESKIRDENTGEMRAMTEEEIYQEAYRRASNRFYHDSNAMTSILGTIYRVPFVGTAARVLIPFVKTPSNVAIRMFEYSPLGLAKSVLYDGLYMMNHNKADNGVGVDFDQYKFVMGVGRGMTGTGLAIIGGLLFKAGILGFGREDEENEKRRGVLASLGEPYGMYVNIGGTKHEISFAQPIAAALAVGAGWAQRMEDDEDFLGLLGGVMADIGNTFFDNSYLSSLNDILSGYGSGWDKIAKVPGQVAASYAQQMFSPAAFRALAKSVDTFARDASSSSEIREFLNKNIIQNWPVLRETLPIRADITGDAMTQHKAYQEGGVWENGILHFVDSFLSPTATYSDKDDPALIELLDLSYRTKETSFLPPESFAKKNNVSVNKTLAKKMKAGDAAFSVSLTDEQQRYVNQMYSSILFNGTGDMRYRKPGSIVSYDVGGLRALIDSDEWKRMDDETRTKKVSEMCSTVKELVTVYVASNFR